MFTRSYEHQTYTHMTKGKARLIPPYFYDNEHEGIPQSDCAAILHTQVWATLQKVSSAVVNDVNLIVNYMSAYYSFRAMIKGGPGDRFVGGFALVSSVVAIVLSAISLKGGI